MSALFNQIDKPTLLLDEAAARRNIHNMAQKARAARFRPHFKTHQSAEIGEWFRAAGVSAITVSSVDMALYFAGHGWEDITIAFPANLRQAQSINALAQRVHLGLLLESVEAAQGLASQIHAQVDIWLKVDAGAGRTGLSWEHSAPAAQVAQAVRGIANFRLRGLLTHAGHTYGAQGAAEICRRYSESVARLQSLRGQLAEQGFHGLEISVGDTPASSVCPDLGLVDEIRPGNFVFYDAQQLHAGVCDWQDVAVALACPVVALHPERSEAVIYGGAVHLSKDYVTDADRRTYGYVCQAEGERWSAPLQGAWVDRLSQEHGILHMATEDLRRVRIGDLLFILPAHSCLTVTLMKRYLTLSGRWITTFNE